MFTCSGKLQENDKVNKAFTSVPQCRKSAGEHYVFMALIVTNYSGKLWENAVFTPWGKQQKNLPAEKYSMGLSSCWETLDELHIFLTVKDSEHKIQRSFSEMVLEG